MRDSEVVASIVAGDPEGLAQAYDRYANALFGYCRSLLREPADAADAVQDTFVIAASRLSGLRNPDLLRPWLYAVARNECLRRLGSREASSAFEDVDAERADETVDVGAEAERAETRALLRAAVDGLNPAERDVITQLLHGLDVAEIAMVLGVSRNHAHSLFSRARQQLEASVGVLLVGRSGRQDCPELKTLLTGWDGKLTAPLRKRIGRHIDKCSVCADRRRRELTPAMLLGLSPAALLGATAALPGTPPQLATGQGPAASAHSGAAGSSHASFGENGFPKPLRTSHLGLAHVPHGHMAAAGGAATAAAAAAAIVVASLGGHHHARVSGSGPLPGSVSATAQQAGAPPGTAPGPGAGPSGRPTAGSPSVRASAAATLSSPGGSATPSQTVPPSASPSGSPTSAPPTPRPSPTPSPLPTGGPTTPAPPPPRPPAVTLGVSPTSITLTPLLGKTIVLTAHGGTVNWSISEPASLLGELTVSPSSGTLAANQSVPVTVTVSGLASLDTQLTVSPGGQQITVVLGLG
jgi:RNA polymerase sigma factor (sigma-70 family)